MTGLDHVLAGQGAGRSLLFVLVVAFLLGLRHAADPDHLVAVSTLVAGEERRRIRRATLLGLVWGLGHAAALAALGLPVVLVGFTVPSSLERSAEIAVGAVIMLLALRLLRQWRRAGVHLHVHAHGETMHRHLHRHGRGGESAHRHDHAPIRSPLQAFGIGVLHGTGGSAAAALLLLSTTAGRGHAAAALVVFASGTALSMAVLSSAFGFVLAREPTARRLPRAAPALAGFTFAFGAWYLAQALP